MIQVDGTVDFDDSENTVDEGSAESNQILYDFSSDIGNLFWIDMENYFFRCESSLQQTSFLIPPYPQTWTLMNPYVRLLAGQS